MSLALAEPAPMIEMNTTPLIDVMLVLLVMMIITIPPQSHAVKLDLPVGPPPRVEVRPVFNTLVVTDSGALLWNGELVAKREARDLLAQSAAMAPAPELHFEPEAGARYALVDETLAMAKQAGVTKMGFVGNQDFAAAF